jgi:curved DNA-binding protein CbpA
MSVEIKDSGNLAEKPASEHFLEAIERSFKGVMVFGRGKDKKSFVLDHGQLLLSSKNLAEGVLGRQLFEQNLLTADNFKKVKEIEAGGKSFFQALMDSQVVQKQLITDFLLKQTLDDMKEVLSWENGQFMSVEMVPSDVTKVESSKKLIHMLFSALLAKYQNKKTKLPDTTRFESIPMQSRFFANDLALNEIQKEIYENLLTKPRNLKTLAADLKQELDLISQIVLSLRELTLVRASTDTVKKQQAVKLNVPTPVADISHIEKDGDLISKIDQLDKMDYFQILGLTKAATAKEVQSVYFALAKKYHPDRVKKDSGIMPKDAERLFALITEAYNTLSNSVLRKEYEQMDSNEAVEQQKIMQKIMDSEKAYLEGKAMLQRGLFKEAVGRIEDAISLYDQEPEYFVSLGWANFRLGIKESKPAKVAEGKKILEEAYQKDYQIDDIPYYLGMIMKNENKIDKAIQYFKKAVQINSNNSLASSELRALEKRTDQGKKR